MKDRKKTVSVTGVKSDPTRALAKHYTIKDRCQNSKVTLIGHGKTPTCQMQTVCKIGKEIVCTSS